jgi:hypothetical protein
LQLSVREEQHDSQVLSGNRSILVLERLRFRQVGAEAEGAHALGCLGLARRHLVERHVVIVVHPDGYLPEKEDSGAEL